MESFRFHSKNVYLTPMTAEMSLLVQSNEVAVVKQCVLSGLKCAYEVAVNRKATVVRDTLIQPSSSNQVGQVMEGEPGRLNHTPLNPI